MNARDLRFSLIEARRAAALCRQWHSTQPVVRPWGMMRFCFGAFAPSGDIVAVALWSRPVARLLPNDWLELRRFAIGPDAPRNTASRMLGWMTREIQGVACFVSYQDEATHRGTIYRACGWVPVACDRGGDWTNRDQWNRSGTRKRLVRWQKKAPWG